MFHVKRSYSSWQEWREELEDYYDLIMDHRRCQVIADTWGVRGTLKNTACI